MLAQQLPQSASNYAAAQRLEQQAAVTAVLRQWRRMGEEFELSWLRIAPTLYAIMTEAQSRVIAGASQFIPDVLTETGQHDHLFAVPNDSQLVGVTGAGEPVEYALGLAPIRAKQAVAAGATPMQALQTAGTWLSATAGSILSDTGRAAEGLHMYSRRGHGGFIRMLTPPSCSRCVVLAGAWYRYNQGFERHPRCDCRHIPVSESMAGDFTVDPKAYFLSLDDAGRIKLAGSKANAAAIADGADIGQVVNAYRRTSGLDFAQAAPMKITPGGDKYTLEATTRRADAYRQQLALRQHGAVRARLMPESIAKVAKDEADRIRLLKLYGWIKDDAAVSRGRTIVAEQRRAERSARATARRAEAKAAAPKTAAGAAGGGRKPPPGTGSGHAGIPDPNDRGAWIAYWRARQDALGIGSVADLLEPHEIEFHERFRTAGHSVRLIPRDRSHPPKPTSDFYWTTGGQRIRVEVRSSLTSNATRYPRLADKIRDAVKAGKDNVILDIRDFPLRRQVELQLGRYNRQNPANPVGRLWVWSQGTLTEITQA